MKSARHAVRSRFSRRSTPFLLSFCFRNLIFYFFSWNQGLQGRLQGVAAETWGGTTSSPRDAAGPLACGYSTQRGAMHSVWVTASVSGHSAPRNSLCRGSSSAQSQQTLMRARHDGKEREKLQREAPTGIKGVWCCQGSSTDRDGEAAGKKHGQGRIE